MARRKDYSAVQKTLRDLLSPVFAGIEIEVSRDRRWQRPVVVARWAGFEGCLPEQRFWRLMQAIPAKVYEEKLAGLVFFELAPGESIDDYLKMPRSEDVADKEEKLIRVLMNRSFFGKLLDALGDPPQKACDGNFTVARGILKECGISPKRRQEICLLLILHGAYCDCQALTTACENIGTGIASVE